jgi:uncharacterized protein (TIGR03000 family)
MYSVVLMMAVTTGAEAPELGRHGCNGGYGCSGYSCGGGGCYGGGCYGGGGCFGGCSGWGGGCHGGGLFGGGCHGGGRGCHGGGLFSGRHGCHGGNSCGCCGGGYGGCYGGCVGGYGCTGCIGIAPAVETKPPLKEMPKEEEISAPATLVVTLPANAKLSIDDTVTTPKNVTTRVFETPALKGGRDFSYTLKAEFEHEGKPVVVSKKVAVRAGAETTVSLGASDLAIAAR